MGGSRNCAQSEPNAWADMPGFANPKSEIRNPKLEGPFCRNRSATRRLRHLTPALSPFEAEREEERTTALSFALWLRKTSWMKAPSLTGSF